MNGIHHVSSWIYTIISSCSLSAIHLSEPFRLLNSAYCLPCGLCIALFRRHSVFASIVCHHNGQPLRWILPTFLPKYISYCSVQLAYVNSRPPSTFRHSESVDSTGTAAQRCSMREDSLRRPSGPRSRPSSSHHKNSMSLQSMMNGDSKPTSMSPENPQEVGEQGYYVLYTRE